MNVAVECLPATGGDASFPLIVALILVGVGVVALIVRRTRSRRAAIMAGGALALALSVFMMPLMQAAPASAADGCPPSSAPTAPPTDPTEVVASAPVLSEAACGVEATVLIPTVEGVTYKQSREGNVVTVTASANAGFALAAGTPSTWAFTIPAVVPCEPPCVPTVPPLEAPTAYVYSGGGASSILLSPAGWFDDFTAIGGVIDSGTFTGKGEGHLEAIDVDGNVLGTAEWSFALDGAAPGPFTQSAFSPDWVDFDSSVTADYFDGVHNAYLDAQNTLFEQYPELVNIYTYQRTDIRKWTFKGHYFDGCANVPYTFEGTGSSGGGGDN